MGKNVKLTGAMKIIAIIAAAAVIGFAVSACEEAIEGVEYVDLLGTWDHQSNASAIIISEGEIIEKAVGGAEVKYEIISFTSVDNTAQNKYAFPDGFNFKTDKNKDFRILLSSNGKSILIGNVVYVFNKNASDPLAAYYGTWVNNKDGLHGPYTLTISQGEICRTDEDDTYIRHTNLTLTAASNPATGYSEKFEVAYPTGHKFTSTRTTDAYPATAYYNFIAKSSNGKKLFICGTVDGTEGGEVAVWTVAEFDLKE
jgi:hypothetical protein